MPVLSKLGRRGKKDDAAETLEVVVKPGGKNRPTPKRSEAIASRPVTPYMKGATSTSRRGRTQADRDARRAQSATRRAAMERGELERDRGPERALARDLIDERRTILTLLVWVAGAAFVLTLIHVSALAVVGASGAFAFFIVAIGEGTFLAYRINKQVRAEFPGSTRKVKLYAIQRAVAPRKMRVPKPRVRAGGQPV
jgi:hypothetical protein